MLGAEQSGEEGDAKGAENTAELSLTLIKKSLQGRDF